MAIVEGTAYWASITRPNEKFEPMWRVDLSVSDKDADEFKSKGINVKESVIDDKTIKKGEIFTENNIKSVRPGYGMHPKYLKNILGKVAHKDFEFGDRLEVL